MNRLTRPNALKIAAGILLVLALIDLVVYQIPSLMLGQAAIDQIANADGSGPPFFMVLLGSAIDILSMITAYGLWRGLRWAVVLGIIISAFNILSGLGGALFAGDMGTSIVSGVGVVLCIGAIVLCLWRERKPQGRAAQVPS